MNSIILYLLHKEEFSVFALIQCSNPFISFISKFSHETAHVFLFECLFLPKKKKKRFLFPHCYPIRLHIRKSVLISNCTFSDLLPHTEAFYFKK